MSKNYITIRSGEGFPWHIKVLAVIFIIVSIIIVAEHPAISAILSFVCLLIFTAHSGVEIDMKNKTYREYMSFFYFLRMGKTEKYNNIEYLFVNSDNVSQKIYTPRTLNSSTFTHREYNAFVKFDNGDKIKLWSQTSKEILLSKLKTLAHQLNTSVIDYTAEQPKESN